MFMEKEGENLFSESDFAEVCVAGEENLAKNTYLTVVLLELNHEIHSHTILSSSSTLSSDKIDGFKVDVVSWDAETRL